MLKGCILKNQHDGNIPFFGFFSASVLGFEARKEEGMKEARKAGRKEARKAGSKEGRKEARKEGGSVASILEQYQRLASQTFAD